MAIGEGSLQVKVIEVIMENYAFTLRYILTSSTYCVCNSHYSISYICDSMSKR